jgi:multidrug efflux system outer membrane protein
LIAASLGEVNARQADYAQAEQTLAAVIAQNYFTLQAGWARLANLEQVRLTQRALVADKAKRLAHGLASSDEQRTVEATLNALNKQYASIDTQNMREREALRALLGADSSALAELTTHALPQISGAFPSSLGIELLARRPDLQAARARVDASLNRIESTQAAFYPDINLTGYFGADSLSLETLLQAPSRTLFIGPTLTLPLFNSARLQARLGAARSLRNELIADYNQTVFNAVRDVAQAGVGLQGLEKQSREQAAATETAHAILRSTQARFQQGLADNASILNAQAAVLEQQDMGLQLQAQELLAEVALTKALGGGYRTQETGVDVAATRARLATHSVQATTSTARGPEQPSE